MPTQSTDPSTAEFTTFMRAYQDMVFSTAARLSGNDAQAQDIAQEVFIRAYEHFQDLRISATAGGWLKTVATNLTINYLNRHRKRWRLFSDTSAPEIELAVADTHLAALGAEQRRAAVEGALRSLPEHQRIPLVLYHFEELSYEEIAVKLRISLAKVKTDIRRARAALLPVLQKRGVTNDTLDP